MVEVAERHTAWVEEFEPFLSGLTLGGPEGLAEKRREAIDRFATLGFPTRRDEEWKYTSVDKIATGDFTLAKRYDAHGITDADLNRWCFDVGDAHRIVFVNGLFSPELSDVGKLPGGAGVDSLAASLASDETIAAHLARHAAFDQRGFVALNTAFLTDGAFVHLAKGAALRKPVHLVYVATAGDRPVVCHPRNLFVAEEDSEGAIVETHVGPDGKVVFTNEVTEVVLGPNARLQHYKLNRTGDRALHVSMLQTYQERTSNFYSQNICLGGDLTRNDIDLYLDGEGIDSTIDGLYYISGTQHVDNHTRVDHAKPHCQSHELYKGILDGEATSCFSGKIFVHEKAQKTDAFQSNRNLLLSETALANTKPQLEIFADDVKCSHGATIGQLDRDALFYLRSRGIPERTAKSLLTYAFANDVIQRVKVEALREALDRHLSHHVPEVRATG